MVHTPMVSGSSGLASRAGSASSSPSQNMPATARRACSTPVEARAGGPITSPAAYTFALEVASVFPSTSTVPRSATSTPPEARPASSSLPTGDRPTAAKKRSVRTVLPSFNLISISSSSAPGGGTYANSLTVVPSNTSTPDFFRILTSSLATSGSMPSFLMEPSMLPLARIVTSFTPRALNMLANSTPMIPRPEMVTERGR
mmetsp:Transcript_9736/g.21130  ORF Transcript_9736/g.21130 Transcript_9736/m.21130 type:complete len:201 (+) Transcript_9736:860-1462(+)